MGHSVVAQSLQLWPTQLHRVITEDIGQQRIGLSIKYVDQDIGVDKVY